MQWWCAANGVPWTWEWTAYPGVWVFVALLAMAFRQLHRRWGSVEEDGRRAVWGYVAIGVIWIALDWPVGALAAGYLTSVKMVQYLLLSLVASPLLLIGLPRGLYRALERGPLGALLPWVTHPLVAMPAFVVIMAWTHWAPVVDALMVQQVGSFFMDTLWLTAGLLFWWPVSAPLPERSWLGDPARVGYLIVATLVNTGVFAYLTFAELPLYAVYELAPPVTGLSTRDDQRLAGLLMKIGGAVILWTAITIIFFRWATREVAPDGRDRSATVAGVLLLAALTGCGSSEESTPVEEAEATAESVRPAAELTRGEIEGVRVELALIGRPPIPGRAAFYMRLVNEGATPIRLVGLEVDGVARASLHETHTGGGMMSMSPVESIRVQPSETLQLRPGGLHGMLEEAEDGFFDQEEVDVRVLLDDGRTILVRTRLVALAELESLLDA
jgi:cytochrome c oxidase assembly factor CtaG/copper(I)-binding protein